MAHARNSLLILPDEILLSVFSFSSIQSLGRCASTCQRFGQLLELPLLWRARCIQSYQFWHPRHSFHELAKQPHMTTTVDWRTLLADRMTQDRLVLEKLEKVVESQVGRMQELTEIVELGYDAKDLLGLIADGVESRKHDGLARQYWAKEALGAIERSAALEEWKKVRDNPDHPMERALGAIEIFSLDRPAMTLDAITERLDRIAKSFILENPDLQSFSTRRKANLLNQFLQRYDLTGVDEDQFYRLQNNFIGIALCEGGHPSLPLISSAIYCCLAKRIKLDAKPCNFPMRVCCIVYPPEGQDLDGKLTDSTRSEIKDDSQMFIDPFGGTDVSVDELSARLDYMGVPTTQRSFYFERCSTADLLCRTANNIRKFLHQSGHEYETCLRVVSLDFSSPDEEHPRLQLVVPSRALYAASCLTLLFGPSYYRNAVVSSNDELIDLVHAHQALSRLQGSLDQHFSNTDCLLVEKHILPLFESLLSESTDVLEERTLLVRILRRIKQDDLGPTKIMRRSPKRSSSPDLTLQEMTWPNNETTWNSVVHDEGVVKHRIGTLFRHKRYNYHGAIIGWDVTCQQSTEWIRQMNVRSLPRGSTQPFYHVIADDESVRYVAEENIDPLESNWTNRDRYMEFGSCSDHGLMRVAGRYFLRFDWMSLRFISNVKETWPDD